MQPSGSVCVCVCLSVHVCVGDVLIAGGSAAINI